ncbi:MAG: hypothetical protein DI582_11060 [Azospirillum brasilense]|nr:MAG: hypothetical protein DI582_11060 [Azospirillum brasilense]
MTNQDTHMQVITTNIACMKTLLEKALLATVEADAAATAKERNRAIGCLLDLEPLLTNAKALYDATLFMHSSAR